MRIPTATATALLAGCVFALSACSGGFVTVAPTPPASFQRLGAAQGEACGSMLFYIAYQFVPVMLNSRVQRAYDRAVDSVPSATALVDVTLKEDWYWWLLGTTRCTTVSGEAVK